MGDLGVFIFWLIVFIVIIIVAIYFLVNYYTNKVLYYPFKKMMKKPDHDFYNLWINSCDDDSEMGDYIPCNYDFSLDPEIKQDIGYPKDHINGWHFEFDRDNNTVLFLHGNAGNISQREYVINICKQYNLNLLLIDYAGFGLSSGSPDSEKICLNGMAAYRYLQKYNIPEDKIIIWGESLGGAVATYVASEVDCRCLILMSTFSCLSEAIYHSTFSTYIKVPLSYLVPLCMDDIPSKERIKKVKCPIAIVHSEEDELISYECAKIMFNNIKNECKIFIKIKGGHSSPILSNDALISLFSFADVCIRSKDIHKMLNTAQDLRTVAEGLFTEEDVKW